MYFVETTDSKPQPDYLYCYLVSNMAEVQKIVIYRSSVCPKCRKAAENLREVLGDLDLRYDDLVVERFVDVNQGAAEELTRYGAMSAPTIRIGNQLLVSEQAVQPDAVRIFIEKNVIKIRTKQ